MLNFVTIRPVGTELFHADGQRDMTKLIAAFHNFANAPWKWWNSKDNSTKGCNITLPKREFSQRGHDYTQLKITKRVLGRGPCRTLNTLNTHGSMREVIQPLWKLPASAAQNGKILMSESVCTLNDIGVRGGAQKRTRLRNPIFSIRIPLNAVLCNTQWWGL